MITIGRVRTQRVARQFVKFCLVGGSGVVVNMALLFVLHEVLRLRLILASPVAVEASILNNFFWNNLWTFRAGSVQPRRLVKFNLVSLVGMAITTGILTFLVEHYGVYWAIANLVAIGVATLWNFALNFLWTWSAEGHGFVG